MRNRSSDGRRAAVFTVAVLTISVTTVRLAGGLLMVLSPLLVTLAMMAVTGEGCERAGRRRLGLFRAGRAQWVPAIAMPVGVSVVATTGVVVLGYARFGATSGWALDALIMLGTAPVLALVEEIGWRGYLQPRLAFLGAGRARLVVGLVWAAWHLPYIFAYSVYHAGGARWITLGLFVGTVVAFSFLSGALRDRSGSVWPSVIAHAAHNWAYAVLGELVTTRHPVVLGEYLAGDTGLFVLLGTTVSALYLSRRRSPTGTGRTTAPHRVNA